MRIPQQGRPKQEVFDDLKSFARDDLAWRSGRAFGYVYNAGKDIAEVGKRAYMDFLSENALDPTEFPSLLRFENEVVSMCITHLGGDSECVGNFTSGGTESILLAVKAARDDFMAKNPGVKPQILLCRTGHAAFYKAAHYYGMDTVITEADPETFQAIPSAFGAAITDRTCLIVGSASQYAHGVVDPIEELAALAASRGIRMHVDGCIGAFVLPFFRELGDDIPPFDFSVPGVTSLSMDLHKYGYCPKGASVVLHRNKDLRRAQIYTCASWSGYTLANPTVQSSRSGGPMAAAWATLQHVGHDGYLELCRGLLEGRRAIVEGVRQTPGLRVLGDPQMCLIAFTSDDPELNIFHLADLLIRRGWYVQPQLSMTNSPANVHLTLTPANLPHMPAFLQDLRACASEARAAESPQISPFIQQALASIDFDSLDDATFTQLLSAAGLGPGGDLPEDRAEINMILDSMVPALRERVLQFFFNELYQQP
ncbi:MAG: aspartate aminotransferase family protein [Deltaproteobacteria bacterium]|nr:MAG: aspartate aminotransferase family protein [Deltaproteobacteria bacterium]